LNGFRIAGANQTWLYLNYCCHSTQIFSFQHFSIDVLTILRIQDSAMNPPDSWWKYLSPGQSEVPRWTLLIVGFAILFYFMTVSTAREKQRVPRLPQYLTTISWAAFVEKCMSRGLLLGYTPAAMPRKGAAHKTTGSSSSAPAIDDCSLIAVSLDWDGLFENTSSIERLRESLQSLVAERKQVMMTLFSSSMVQNTDRQFWNPEGITEVVTRIVNALGDSVHYWVTFDLDPLVVKPENVPDLLAAHAVTYHTIKRAVTSARVGLTFRHVRVASKRWISLLDMGRANALDAYLNKVYLTALSTGTIAFPAAFGHPLIEVESRMLTKACDFMVVKHRQQITNVQHSDRSLPGTIKRSVPADGKSFFISLNAMVQFCNDEGLPLFVSMQENQRKNADHELGYLMQAVHSSSPQDSPFSGIIFDDPVFDDRARSKDD
jgi:hypothetical protein